MCSFALKALTSVWFPSIYSIIGMILWLFHAIYYVLQSSYVMTLMIYFFAEPQLMDNSIDSVIISPQEDGQPQVSMKIKVSDYSGIIKLQY